MLFYFWCKELLEDVEALIDIIESLQDLLGYLFGELFAL